MTHTDLYDQPIPGVKMLGPKRVPAPGEVVIGYEIVDHNVEKKLFVKPRPKYMNVIGWASVFVTAVCFWPASCVPCCLRCSYSRAQRPVYGVKQASKEVAVEIVVAPEEVPVVPEEVVKAVAPGDVEIIAS